MLCNRVTQDGGAGGVDIMHSLCNDTCVDKWTSCYCARGKYVSVSPLLYRNNKGLLCEKFPADAGSIITFQDKFENLQLRLPAPFWLFSAGQNIIGLISVLWGGRGGSQGLGCDKSKKATKQEVCCWHQLAPLEVRRSDQLVLNLRDRTFVPYRVCQDDWFSSSRVTRNKTCNWDWHWPAPPFFCYPPIMVTDDSYLCRTSALIRSNQTSLVV